MTMEKTQNIDLSLITVNFNGVRDTLEMIDSVKTNLTSIRYEIIVVDNGSRINEAKTISEKFPDIVVLRSDDNLGFAGGNNLGINVATGRYVMLINNDTLVPDDSLSSLVLYMDSHPNAGAVSPKIVFFKPENTVQFAGYTELSNITLRNNLIGFGEQDRGQYSDVKETPYCHGAAMVLRKDVLDKVGLMPEIFFLYYEEIDWCTKISRAGFKQYFYPNSVIIHKESSSTGQGSPLRNYYLVRNRLLYAWRNRKGITLILSILYQILIAVPKSIILNIISGRIDLISSTFKGIKDFVYLKEKSK